MREESCVFPAEKSMKQTTIMLGTFLRLAAKRQILEEVGLDLKDEVKYITSNYFQETDKVIVNLFHCKMDKTDLNIQPSSREVVDWFWLTAEEINQADNTPSWLKTQVNHLMQKSMNQP